MDETSKARDELDRLGRSLRRQLVALITDLTVRVHLRRLSLDEPKVADRREPLRYHYATVYQGNRPKTATAADTASRAAFLLRAAGWDVTASQEDDDGRLWTVIDAHRDGNGIRILTSDDTPAVAFRAQTPALALCPPQPVQQPEPVRTPETVTPGHVLCYEGEASASVPDEVVAGGCLAAPTEGADAGNAPPRKSDPSAGARVS
ncbi:hypothetical protein ADL22_00115 [Streptomyces sp. NRRL F-4489]|uniref:hypothetical protein n=1 Tax=Streptomyces sp. NRRL F-4489 TaxID=1609095 RepID=UPI0007486743|nr:hypothetical protein [Streptomyces sp. NRRL F-4489]KUL55344.1 hypothetical protein ADL22_00115 [Streptomyces sp. NRRL F-4489]